MRKFLLILLATVMIPFTVSAGAEEPAVEEAELIETIMEAVQGALAVAVRGEQVVVNPPPETTTTTTTTTVAPARWPSSFRMSECGWVRSELQARNVKGWVVDFLVGIAERESKCCPFVKGGDRTNQNCSLSFVAEYNHRSDTGLFQLNGTHWKTSRGFICPEFTCSQDVLLYDIDMQFDAMLVLFSMCGTKPWTAPNYGCSGINPYN